MYLNFRARSTFQVPVCTVPSTMDRTSRCNKVDAVRLYASYRLNLLLLKGQRCDGTYKYTNYKYTNYKYTNYKYTNYKYTNYKSNMDSNHVNLTNTKQIEQFNTWSIANYNTEKKVKFIIDITAVHDFVTSARSSSFDLSDYFSCISTNLSSSPEQFNKRSNNWKLRYLIL